MTAVESCYPNSVEVVSRIASGFPLIYFFRRDAKDYLGQSLVRGICKGKSLFLSCAKCPIEVQDNIVAYVSSASVHSELVRTITNFFKGGPQLLKITDLLCDLSVYRILLSSPKKRWSVQYGLHLTRAPITVPYGEERVIDGL